MANLDLMLDDDLMGDLTPDMHSLRYKGPIPVFLYGGNTYYQWLKDFFKEKGLSAIIDYYTIDNTVETACRLLALKSKNPEKAPFKYPSFAVVNHQAVTDLTPQVVRGRLITVSLAGLRALDTYFFNGYRSDRIQVPLKKKSYGNTQHDWAYTWVFDADTLTSDGKFGKKYDFDTFRCVTINNQTYYAS